MKICVAQLRPVKGDVERNIDKHKQLLELALSNGADAVIFPELSITGYEPELAKDLATTLDDIRFDTFQAISDAQNMTIGVGMPIRSDAGIRISMLIFQSNKPRQTYAKQHLHADEEPYFVGGQGHTFLMQSQHKMALAICYELSVPEHAEYAFQQGATLYVASVAKSASGVTSAAERLSAIAWNYAMIVLMANSVGPSDNFEGAGRSAIWNWKGELVGQLDDTQEGILLIDTETQTVVAEML